MYFNKLLGEKSYDMVKYTVTWRKRQLAAEILNGTRLAQTIRNQIRKRLKELNFIPGLAVIQVGDDPASSIYIKHKQRDCAKVNIHSELHHLPVDITQKTLLKKVLELNVREDIHGILVQMPLPNHIDEQEVVDAIAPDKDADGLTAYNLGNLFINRESITPCTPTGIIRLLELTGESIEGKHAVCVGRSHLVGKPVGVMLLNCNATVTYCHSRTKNLAAVTKQADILVAAVGKPEFITADMVKEDATVIDVGINTVADRLIGDVKFDEVKEIAGYITPVPGGVGPLTRAMLLENTLKLAIRMV